MQTIVIELWVFSMGRIAASQSSSGFNVRIRRKQMLTNKLRMSGRRDSNLANAVSSGWSEHQRITTNTGTVSNSWSIPFQMEIIRIQSVKPLPDLQRALNKIVAELKW